LNHLTVPVAMFYFSFDMWVFKKSSNTVFLLRQRYRAKHYSHETGPD